MDVHLSYITKVNAGDCLTSEEEKDLRACLEDLDQEYNTVERGTNFKD